MALILDGSIEWASDGKSFEQFDDTGTYSVDNLGGYGIPNVLATDASTATLSIWNPGTDNLPDPTATASSVIDMYSTLPNYSGKPFVVTNALAGFGTSVFSDGVYYMTYTITGNSGGSPFTYSFSSYYFFDKAIRCCLDTWQNDLLADSCCASTADFNRYNLAELKYQAMLNEKCCSHINKAADLLTQLQKMCPNDCGCS